MTAEDRVRTVREAYQATNAANRQGGPWNNPWAAVVAALDAHDEPHTKALAEVATKLGYELGRKEAGEEIAAALEAVPAEVYSEEFFPVDGASIDCQSARVMRFAYPAAARIARDITSQPSGGPTEPLTAPTSHSDLPEDARPPQGPCEDPACPIVLMHSHPLPNEAPVVDLVGRLRDAVDAARERRLNPPDLTKGGQ